jgi:hypothetical protein
MADMTRRSPASCVPVRTHGWRTGCGLLRGWSRVVPPPPPPTAESAAPELLTCLADCQIQVIRQVSPAARLLSPRPFQQPFLRMPGRVLG